MNNYQQVWWKQVKSDHSILELLRLNAALPCHQLHYLQMVTEKLAKAFFWRSDQSPGTTHSAFVYFLRFLVGRSDSETGRIALRFGFGNAGGFRNWIRSILPLAYEIEKLAPSLAADGPNPEYPWPMNAPAEAPATWDFELWNTLEYNASGRRLRNFIDAAVREFPNYA